MVLTTKALLRSSGGPFFHKNKGPVVDVISDRPGRPLEAMTLPGGLNVA